MSNVAAELLVNIKGVNVNLDRLLPRIEADLKRVDAAGLRTGASLGTSVASGARQASSGLLGLQSSMARVEASQGNLVGAANRLRTALAQVGTSTPQATSALKQLHAIELQLAAGTTGLGNTLKTFASGVGSSLVGMVAPAAAAGAALSALTSVGQSFAEAFVFKAKLDESTASVNAQLAGIRDMGKGWGEAAAFANRYKLTQQETNAILSSSVDVLRTSSSSITDLESTLLRLQSRDVSKPISEAARALRELNSGDTTTIKELFNISANDANRMKNEIAAGGDAVQVLSSFLDSAGNGMASLEQRTKGAMGAMRELQVAMEQAKIAQGELATGEGTQLVLATAGGYRALAGVLGGDLPKAMAGTGQAMTTQSALLSFLAERAGLSRLQLAQMGIQLQLWGTQSQGAAGATEANTNAINLQSPAMVAAAGSTTQAAAAIARHTVLVTDSSGKLVQLGDVTRESALQSQIDAESKAAQAERVRVLQEEANAAVAEFLRLNPQIDASGIAAAVAAGRIDPFIGQLAALRLEAVDTASSIAHLNSVLLGGVGKLNPTPNLGRGLTEGLKGVGAVDVEVIGTRLSDAAQSDLRRVQKLYSDFFANLNKPRGGGGGGGGTRLSDQTKLSNQLLADQQRFSDKAEDEEQNHVERMIAIATAAAAKRADALNQFNQDALDSRASFYLSLANVENAGLQGAMSERFEAIQQEAARIEQQSGADAALAFENAATKALQDQSRIQEAIAKAQEEGQGGKAEFLTGVLAAQVRADEARLERIKASGSAIATEEAKQQGEEIARFEAQSGKIITAADRAALAKIAAAQRGGQAVDIERLSVESLVASYERLGTVSTRGTAAAPSQAAPAAPGTTAAAAGGPLDLAAVVAAVVPLQGLLQQLITLAGEEVRATREGASQVAGAVSSRAFS